MVSYCLHELTSLHSWLKCSRAVVEFYLLGRQIISYTIHKDFQDLQTSTGKMCNNTSKWDWWSFSQNDMWSELLPYWAELTRNWINVEKQNFFSPIHQKCILQCLLCLCLIFYYNLILFCCKMIIRGTISCLLLSVWTWHIYTYSQYSRKNNLFLIFCNSNIYNILQFKGEEEPKVSMRKFVTVIFFKYTYRACL